MGFSTLIDILGSSIVGGMLLLILWRLNDAATQNTVNYGGEVIVQQNLVETVAILEYDFRKIGYCKDWTKIPDPSKAILLADSTSIKFLTDFDNNGLLDSLSYFLGSESALTSTPNPRDRMLYRVENANTPGGSNLGVTKFRLTYFDVLGNILNFPITNPNLIATMQIDLKVESPYAYNNEYPTVFWRQIRMTSRNLRNR